MTTVTAARLVRAGGLLIFAGGIVHATLGLPGEVLLRVEQGQIQGDAAGPMVVNWVYAGLAMMTIGLLVGSISDEIRRGRRGAFRQCLLVALVYVGFGGWAFVHRGADPHFLGFVCLGLLVGLPLLLSAKEYRND